MSVMLSVSCTCLIVELANNLELTCFCCSKAAFERSLTFSVVHSVLSRNCLCPPYLSKKK